MQLKTIPKFETTKLKEKNLELDEDFITGVYADEKRAS
jgi:hypothetical protein